LDVHDSGSYWKELGCLPGHGYDAGQVEDGRFHGKEFEGKGLLFVPEAKGFPSSKQGVHV
ncbi:hypothetical protein GGF44_002077, partial [Coemansia sp. RSA 1694]